MVPDSITLPIGSIAPYEPVLMPAGNMKHPRVSPEPDSPAESILKSSRQTNTNGQLLDDAEGRSGVTRSVLPDQSRLGSRFPLAIADMDMSPRWSGASSP